MGGIGEAEKPGVAGDSAAIQDLQEAGEPTPEEREDAIPGSVEAWPDEKPGISPEEEEALLKVSDTLCKRTATLRGLEVQHSFPFCC